MVNPIHRIAIYVKNMQTTADFYQENFDFHIVADEAGQLIELEHSGGGCNLIILQASKGHRVGQSCVKLVFDVEDVAKFRAEKMKDGLKFGAIHEGDGYEFSNARDPGKNPIQISSRAYRA